MTSVVFVHGAGVREAGFACTIEMLKIGLAEIRPSVTLVPCYWGDPFGARLAHGGASIPEGMVARGEGDPLYDPAVDCWLLLELDPLIELGLIATASARARPAELAPDMAPAGQRFRERALLLAGNHEIRAAVRDCGLAETFGAAVTTVLGSPVTRDAFAVGDWRDLAGALARAFLASALVAADSAAGGLVPLDGQRRDALVRLLTAALGDEARGIVGRALRVSAHLAVELGATRELERRRLALSGAASPFAGDVLVFLTRGSKIIEHIGATVTAVDDDVVLLAHSLGGIACVDLLATAPPANVRGLITVGSQASYLHEIGALPNLEPESSLPNSFPVPWINVFDRRDLLAFLAEPIFGERVRDVEVDSRAPFPRSHSAYFGNPALYAVVDYVLTAIRG